MGRRVVLLLLAACLAVPALAIAADTDPQKRYTAADQAKAKSLLLRRGDLVAGWKQSPAGKDAGDSDYTCAGYNPDFSDLTETGEAEVEFSNGGGAMLFSYASLMRSPEQAVVSWRRGNTPAFARCLAQVVTKGLSDVDAKAKVTSYGRMPFPKLAPGSPPSRSRSPSAARSSSGRSPSPSRS